ncbi:MFS transporter [Marinicaulis flavus]|uniref:MFS transporter n=2 Tax=Hyphococcus luteus TaxID=2058213 RepID=A0A2S7K8J5_9PROT|nr:MFS transporter [Marinicaulis flavus]
MRSVPSFSIFRHQGYRHYWIARQLISAERQMVAIAIGWQIYDLSRLTRSIEESAFMLGLVGLTQFVPILVLSLPGGQAADRFDRKKILVYSNIVRFFVISSLFAASFMPAHIAIPAIFFAAFGNGAVSAFTPSASNSLYPRLVPRDELPLAIAWNSLGMQGAAMLGPAIGGFLFIGGAYVVYGAAAFLTAVAVVMFATAETPPHEPVHNVRGWSMIVDGLKYVFNNKLVLGSITLDLIVVFFGSVTALLPVFARDILMVGSEGLGLLRAAPAVGAAIVAFLLAANPLERKVGPWLLGSIVIYGLSMLGFGFSKIFWLSLLMLAIGGAADMVSMFIRQSIVQHATPDHMRGRVSSVSFIFIAASNQLGEFESGVAARFLGPIGAVFLGGVVSLVTVASWLKLFPTLSRADRFEEVEGEAKRETSPSATS